MTPRPFDPLGPVVRQLPAGDGRILNYIAEGSCDWPTFVFIGGAGTSVRAFRLLEFARGLREELCLRVIGVERNGFGQTPFGPGLGFDDYAEDVLRVLDHLQVHDFAIVAISGGGPYAARVALRGATRVTSFHLACAFSDRVGHPDNRWSAMADDALVEDSARLTRDPANWWVFPTDSPVHRIPGFADSAIEEGTRAFFAAGQMGSPEPLIHERRLARDHLLPDMTVLGADCYLYWGSADPLVPTSHLDRWREMLPGSTVVRLYAGEGHDIQYRHWSQILLDLAGVKSNGRDPFDWEAN
jgi:non-heme chloroperoxidase